MKGLFRLEDSEKLNGFISRQLRKAVSDDSIEVDMLRDYVDLLLKRDEDISSLKASCKSELGEFLKEGTDKFVNLLFQAIERGDFEIKQVSGGSGGGQRSSPSHNEGYDEDGDGRKRGREDDHDGHYGNTAANLYGNSNDTYGHNQYDKRSRLYDEPWRGRGRGSFADRGGRGHYERGRGSYDRGRGYSARGGRGGWNASFPSYGQYGDDGSMQYNASGEDYSSSMNDSYGTAKMDAGGAGGDQCTLKCAEIPNYVKEQDLLKHFYKFGRVVNSHRVDAGVLLVQYSSSHEASKCFNSPQAVLNNRFIQLNMNDTNIEDPMTARDKKYRGHTAGSSRDKSKNYYSKEGEGEQDMVTSDAADYKTTTSATTPLEKPQEPAVDTAELDYGLDDDEDGGGKGAASTSDKDKEVAKIPKTPQASSAVKSEGSAGAGANDDTPADTTDTAAEEPVHVLTQEDIELKKKHAEAKKLKEQRESIHKTKENVLQNHIAKCKEMLAKLENNEANLPTIEKLEAKIVEFQKKYAETVLGETASSRMVTSSSRGRGGRGRGRGRASPGRGRGSYTPRGRGRGGGGSANKFTRDT